MDDMTLSLRELAASENDKDDIDNSVEKEEISDNQPCTKY